MASSLVMIFGAILGAGAVVIGIIRLKKKKSWGHHNAHDEIDVRWKTILITGGTSGLGKEVAYEMLKRGALVIIPGRTMSRALEAVADLKKRPGAENGTMVPMELDLSSLKSIKTFAELFKNQFDHLDILINNAGVYTYYDKDRVTKDGFEYNFGVNYVSHFLLTNLLLDHCKTAAKNGDQSRIVNVSSSLHESGELRLDDLNLRNLKPEQLKSVKPYNNSKLAQVYFSNELARRLSMTGVHTYCLCPGWVYTDLGRDVLKWYKYILVFPFAMMFMRSPNQGCQTILHCALSNDCSTETGKLYRNCEIWRSSAHPIVENKAGILWDKTEEMINKIQLN